MVKILYRQYDEDFAIEFESAKKYFEITPSRMDINKGDLVIGRYSVLPFYEEQEYDLKKVGAKLINSYRQHRYVANIRNWYEDLKQYTPKTWFAPNDVPRNEQGFILKGETNSKKFLWNTHMFGETWGDMMGVYCKLLDDSLIGQQDICIRKYEKLKTYLRGVNNLPITKEFRIFVCYGKIMCVVYYWSNFTEELNEMGIFPNFDAPKDLIEEIIKIISPNINFFVMDVAEKDNGDWILIELNDGQMSGLSDADPDILYGNLKKVISD